MNSIYKPLALTVVVLLLGTRALHAQEEDDVSPLDGVIADMQVAGGRLAKQLTDKPTQQKQQDAVDKLNALIKLLEERRRQSGNQVNPNPNKPAEESTVRMGPGGSGPLHDARRNGRGWGQLPPHKRQQILQSMTEGFPPHYQQLLERYYRRLAEEKPAGEASEETATPLPAGQSSSVGGKKSSLAMEKPATGPSSKAASQQPSP
jgi:hypothetical protein